MHADFSAGTRVVTRSEMVVPNTDRSIPAGAVGVIVRRMSEDEVRVRFPEGVEFTLPASELDLLKRTSEGHARLTEITRGCITRRHAHHYLGFAANQWKMFEKDDPPRVKPLLYVFRVLLTGIHLMETGEVEANLGRLNERFRLRFIDELIERKISGSEQETLAEAERERWAVEVARLTARLESARDATRLPEVPRGREQLNALLLELRGV